MKVTAARVARNAAKKFDAHRPFELLIARAEESFQTESDAADVVHKHVDAAVIVDRALDKLAGPIS